MRRRCQADGTGSEGMQARRRARAPSSDRRSEAAGPCVILRSTSALVQEADPVDWPRHGRARSEQRRPASDFRDAERSQRDPRSFSRSGSPSGSSSHTSCPDPASGTTSTRSVSGRSKLAEQGRPASTSATSSSTTRRATCMPCGLVGIVEKALPSLDLIKIPAILADIGVAALIWSMIRELGGGRRAALVGAGLYLSSRSPGSTASSGARSIRSGSSSSCSRSAPSGATSRSSRSCSR